MPMKRKQSGSACFPSPGLPRFAAKPYTQHMSGTDVLKQSELDLRPCKHQVAGHLFEDGKAGSLVDDCGHFYKPLQVGPRGRRERAFYERVRAALEVEEAQGRSAELETGGMRSAEQLSDDGSEASVSGRGSDDDDAAEWRRLPFAVRHATLLQAIPRFHGVVEAGGRQLVALEDVALRYGRPCIIDIKLGFRTWYPTADPAYIQRCKVKDAATTQATLGYKICGMQVYRHCQRGYWRASKRWCKQLPRDMVDQALLRFANNEAGLRPADIYGGPHGAIAQLRRLQAWFQRQRELLFYSSSVLIMYEGDATVPEDAAVSLRLVDFAHTFASEGQKDTNFIAGLGALIRALSGVLHMDHQECLI